MRFWEEQRKARRWTTWYLILFLVLTLGTAILAEMALRALAPQQYSPPEPILAIGFVVLTCGVALYQYLMFRKHGGPYVAESVGGRLVPLNTADPAERRLLNIVAEVAVASGVTAPPVYLLDSEQINAFAAGLTPDRAAIAITRGALKKLSRAEAQGVIAHEFGHIYNGDMKISLTVAALVAGFFVIMYVGLRTMQISAYSGGGGRRGGNVLAIVGVLLVAAGIFSWIAGSILKATISRQREYLADASGIQFTRNPDGLAGALRKIGEEQVFDMPPNGMAISHMYLDNRGTFSAIFATHPPLKERIKRITQQKEIAE